MEFTKQELNEIYDAAVNELECSFHGSLEDIDVANEPVEKFDIDSNRIPTLQSIVKKIGGETI